MTSSSTFRATRASSSGATSGSRRTAPPASSATRPRSILRPAHGPAASTTRLAERWLQDLKDHPEAQKAFKLKDWNAYEIEARGPHIKITLNGVPCVDYLDTADLEGFIALQVHVGKAGEIRWKNVRIKDLGRSNVEAALRRQDPRRLGAEGGGRWIVEDGTIRRHQRRNRKRTADSSSRSRSSATSPSGSSSSRRPVTAASAFRSMSRARSATGASRPRSTRAMASAASYENGRACSGRPAEARGREEMDQAERLERAFGHRAWGIGWWSRSTASSRRRSSIPRGRKRGKLALQLHGGQDVDVRFKDIEVIELGPTSR